jgi:general secretion pathway protein D
MQRLPLSAAALVAAALTIGSVAPAQERPAASRPAQAAPAPEAAPVAPAATQPARPESALRQEHSVDIEELFARVAASTGKEFLVDPRVRARVFAVPDIGTPTYAELLSILRMHGFAAAEIGGRVNVVPDANARFMPARLLQRDDPSVPDDEYVMRVIAVPNAAMLVPVLRPLMPQSAHLAAMMPPDGGTEDGKLILVDYYANVRKMTELINTLVR